MRTNTGLVRKLLHQLNPTCPLLRCLKAINQTIIAPPYIQIKNQFASINAPFSDVPNKWVIHIVVVSDDVKNSSPNSSPSSSNYNNNANNNNMVSIMHTKFAKSTFKDKDYSFDFSW